jgi:hypothetical protein
VNANAHRRQCHIVDPKSDQLGRTQARTDGQMQHRAIPNPIASRWIWDIEHSLNFFSSKIRDQSCAGFLERDCQNAADLLERWRLTVFEEVEEGFYCRQSHIAGLWCILTFVLQIFQEGADQSRIKLLEQECRRLHLEPFGGELEQQLEAIGVGVARVLAGSAVKTEVLSKEGLDVGRDRRHD